MRREPGLPDSFPQLDRRDSYAGVMLRREINSYAVPYIDPYDRAFDYIQRLLPPIETVILDVGCGSGEFVVEAAKRADNTSPLIGIDVNDEGYRHVYGQQPPANFSFIQASGEDIPLESQSVHVTMAHNVVFRSPQPYKMLEEMRRVTVPGGFIFLSTNAPEHGLMRHGLEYGAGILLAKEYGLDIPPVNRPAEKFFIQKAVDCVDSIAGLSVFKTEEYEADIQVTKDRLPIFMAALLWGANEAEIPIELHAEWRRLMREMAEPVITREIEQSEDACFTDISHRALIVAIVE